MVQTVKNPPALRETWVPSLVVKIRWGRERLHCSNLENSMDCIVHGVAKSRTRVRDFHFYIVLTLSCKIISESI